MCSWMRKNLYRLPHVIEPSSVITQRIWLTWGMGKMKDMLHNLNRGSVGRSHPSSPNIPGKERLARQRRSSTFSERLGWRTYIRPEHCRQDPGSFLPLFWNNQSFQQTAQPHVKALSFPDWNHPHLFGGFLDHLLYWNVKVPYSHFQIIMIEDFNAALEWRHAHLGKKTRPSRSI